MSDGGGGEIGGSSRVISYTEFFFGFEVVFNLSHVGRIQGITFEKVNICRKFFKKSTDP